MTLVESPTRTEKLSPPAFLASTPYSLPLPVAVVCTGSFTPIKPARKSPFLPGGAAVVVVGGGGVSPTQGGNKRNTINLVYF